MSIFFISGSLVDIISNFSEEKRNMLESFFLQPCAAQSKPDQTISKDIPRADFLGTVENQFKLLQIWEKTKNNTQLTRYYAQGNIDGGVGIFLCGPPPFYDAPFLSKADQDDETKLIAHKQNLIISRFSYMDKNDCACGLIIAYCKDDPTK